MKKIGIVLMVLVLGMLFFRCEDEYSDRSLYIAVAGDYGVPFTGSYGDQYEQYDVHSRTPDYYYFHLRETGNNFVGEFTKSLALKEDFRSLTVRLYLKDFPEPASLLVEITEQHPESMIVVTYCD